MAYRINYFSKTKRKNKYNAKSQQFGGRTYHSRFEARYAEDLEWRKKAGEILDIKPQHKIEIKVNGVHIASYYADFRVVLADGTIQYHECKGFSTDLFRLKWKLVNALTGVFQKIRDPHISRLLNDLGGGNIRTRPGKRWLKSPYFVLEKILENIVTFP